MLTERRECWQKYPLISSMATVLRVVAVNRSQHKILLLLSPLLLVWLLINPAFGCELNQWVPNILCVRSMASESSHHRPFLRGTWSGTMLLSVLWWIGKMAVIKGFREKTHPVCCGYTQQQQLLHAAILTLICWFPMALGAGKVNVHSCMGRRKFEGTF